MDDQTDTVRRYGNASCVKCGKHDYVTPLHGDAGGPMCCLLCIGEWHGKHGRRRRLGRIVIRAIRAYLDGGGYPTDIEKLKISAFAAGGDLQGILTRASGDLDPLGYLADAANTVGETVELTSELLADAIRLTHSDNHPPERQELSHRVTAGLLALQPFVFPAPKQLKPEGERVSPWPDKSDKPRFPCAGCADTTPNYYCTPCRTEWEARQEQEHQRETVKRRAWRERRKPKRPPTVCASCGTKFKGKRSDASYCSDACRQRAHRKSA